VPHLRVSLWKTIPVCDDALCNCGDSVLFRLVAVLQMARQKLSNCGLTRVRNDHIARNASSTCAKDSRLGNS
jgi:hypothetical protein